MRRVADVRRWRRVVLHDRRRQARSARLSRALLRHDRFHRATGLSDALADSRARCTRSRHRHSLGLASRRDSARSPLPDMWREWVDSRQSARRHARSRGHDGIGALADIFRRPSRNAPPKSGLQLLFNSEPVRSDSCDRWMRVAGRFTIRSGAPPDLSRKLVDARRGPAAESGPPGTRRDWSNRCLDRPIRGSRTGFTEERR